MAGVKFRCLYIKHQMIAILRNMDISDPLPARNEKLEVKCQNGDTGIVSVSIEKSTYGKTLYEYVILEPESKDGK